MGCPLKGLSGLIASEGVPAGGADAGKRSSNEASGPGRGIEPRGANGTAGAPASNAFCSSPETGTRTRRRGGGPSLLEACQGLSGGATNDCVS